MPKVLPQNAIDLIKGLGPRSLPDNPAQSNIAGKQVKATLSRQAEMLCDWLAKLDDEVALKNTVAKVVSELPQDLSAYENGTMFILRGENDLAFYKYDGSTLNKVGLSLAEYIDRIEGVEDNFDPNGAALKAKADQNGDVIDSTYETKTAAQAKLDGVIDGTYVAGKAVKDQNGDTIDTTYAKKGSDNNFSGSNYFYGPANAFYHGLDVHDDVGFRSGSGIVANSGKSNFKITLSNNGAPAYYYFPFDGLDGAGSVYTIATTSQVASAKAEAIGSAAATAQEKVDALANELTFSNGVFDVIRVAKFYADDMQVTHTETTSARVEDQFIEMLAGNTEAYGSNYVGHVFAKYDGENDFFVGIYNDTLMIGDCTILRHESSDPDEVRPPYDITPISLEPIMSRAQSSALSDNHLLMWDDAGKRAVDANVTATEINAVLSQESERVLAESARALAETARQEAEAERVLQEKYRVINHPYAITQAEYNTLINGGVFGVHLSTPLIEGDEPELIYTVYASEELAEAAEETYIFPMQENIEYPAKDVGGDSPYLNIPAPPQADGTYIPKCTVSNGVVTYFWEAE